MDDESKACLGDILREFVLRPLARRAFLPSDLAPTYAVS